MVDPADDDPVKATYVNHKRSALAFTPAFATRSQRQRVDDAVAYASRLLLDPQRKERVEQSQCPCCFYAQQSMGRVFTTTSCGVCGIEVRSFLTEAISICKGCADTHGLCFRCGADRELNVRRGDYPEPNSCD